MSKTLKEINDEEEAAAKLENKNNKARKRKHTQTGNDQEDLPRSPTPTAYFYHLSQIQSQKIPFGQEGPQGYRKALETKKSAPRLIYN
ncbi:hypothetical protein NW766_001988 [Fusarium irregulare]|uniref:Uncharacterized protein n=1 Tax=Fusarium irregulare TaxID=2494466 RepID=A0A9W8PWU2_9HYPO|nr:hypothetical protein NW766_001988 [Fusarium irregulare]